ncbi:MAG: hypothetical protein LR015_12150 [Verrucomicrobia bacterium]|nr:hypothetical protein [Verrucomicrobiota bacterium]
MSRFIEFNNLFPAGSPTALRMEMGSTLAKLPGRFSSGYRSLRHGLAAVSRFAGPAFKPNLSMLAVSGLLLLPCASGAQTGELGLREAIHRALAQNLGLRIDLLEPEIAADAVERERGFFDF